MAEPEVHEDSVDGVRAFWVDGPPPLQATLGFRVGWADETLRSHGVTHLVEHLALSGVGLVPHFFNGSVSLNLTALTAAGTADEVTRFLGAACGRLTDLPMERLETEIGILEAEDAPRRASAFDQMCNDLFGSAGPGIRAYPEHALSWVGPEDVAAWSAAKFTRENAVLALTGPPPPGVALPLHHGEWRPPSMPARPEPVPTRRSARRRTSHERAAVLALTRRTPAGVLAGEILRDRLFSRLRQALGLVYEIDSDYIPLDGERALLFAGTRVEERHSRRVSTEMLASLESLMTAGPSAEELDLARARRTAAAEAPAEARLLPLLYSHAWGTLFGDDPGMFDPSPERFVSVTAAEIAAALAAALESGMVMVSPGVRGFDAPLTKSDLPPPGKRYKRKGAPPRILSRAAPAPPGPEALVIGPDAVAVAKEGRWVTLTRDDIAATRWRSGPTLNILGASGRWLIIDPAQWSAPAEVLRELDRLVPPATDVPDHRGDTSTWRPQPR